MFPQELGKHILLLVLEALNGDRLTGSKSPPRGRSQVGGQGRGPYYALFPSNAGSNQQVRLLRTVTKDLYVIDFYSPGNLKDDLVEKPIQIGTYARQSTYVDENADMPPNFVERQDLVF